MDLVLNSYTKTRIAPTPSGFLHLGNVFSFAITAYLAKKTGAKILLRIDDLDQARVNDAYLVDIFETLHFLNIPWQEGPTNLNEFKERYSQTHRLGLYNQALTQLSEAGLIYACACSRSELNKPGFECLCINKNIPLQSNEVAWRLFTQEDSPIKLKDISGNYQNCVLPADMNNFIIRKKDGFPAYQLTSVVDDLFYGVDLIIRGEDLLPSTLAQQVLAKALQKSAFSEIAFYHHPLVKSAEGEKLSKSAGATSVQHLRQQGFKSKDIYQSIASMAGIKTKFANYEQLAEQLIAL